MIDNVIRHLLGAGQLAAALKLLTDYQWMERIYKEEDRASFQQIIAALHLLQAHVERYEKTEMGRTVIRDISIITTAMELSISYSIKNRRECTFQLYRRLRDLKSESGIVERIVHSIAKHGRRP